MHRRQRTFPLWSHICSLILFSVLSAEPKPNGSIVLRSRHTMQSLTNENDNERRMQQQVRPECLSYAQDEQHPSSSSPMMNHSRHHRRSFFTVLLLTISWSNTAQCFLLPSHYFTIQQQLLPQHHGIITTSSSPNKVRTNASPTITTPLLISLQNCPPSLLPTMSKSSSRKHFSENDDIHNKNDGDALPLTIQSGGELFRSKMESFSSNVSRLRVKRKRHMLNRSGNNSDRGRKGEESIASIDNALIGGCNSLVYFLRDEASKFMSLASSSSTSSISSSSE